MGKIIDVAVDIRKNSRTYGKHFKIVLSDKNCTSLYIPEGFAHGYCVLSDSCLMHYKMTNYRDKKLERGINWNDKFISYTGFRWWAPNVFYSRSFDR